MAGVDVGVEGGERLVQQQQTRSRRQRAGQCHPLLLPAGELGRDAGRRAGRRPPREQFTCAGLRRVARDTLGARPERDVRQRGEVGEQERLLGEQADAAAVRRDVHAGGDVGQRRPADPHVSGIRTQQPGEHVEKCRLARPVRAQHAENLARGDGQGEVQRETGAGDRDGDVEAGRLRCRRRGAADGGACARPLTTVLRRSAGGPLR